MGDEHKNNKQTYKIKFQSSKACEEVRDRLKANSNSIATITSDECLNREELQVDVILEIVEQVYVLAVIILMVMVKTIIFRYVKTIEQNMLSI